MTFALFLIVFKTNIQKFEIKFGTDGWRGVIADDFTFERVEKVAQAIADYYKTQEEKGKGIVIGYDTRFLSSEFAIKVAQVLTGNGIPVLLSQSDVPTQAVSFTVLNRKLLGGIMITASHNPPRFNGILLISQEKLNPCWIKVRLKLHPGKKLKEVALLQRLTFYPPIWKK